MKLWSPDRASTYEFVRPLPAMSSRISSTGLNAAPVPTAIDASACVSRVVSWTLVPCSGWNGARRKVSPTAVSYGKGDGDRAGSA
jgi:hypothetical protein